MKRNPDDTVCQPAAAAEMPQTYVNTHTHTHTHTHTQFNNIIRTKKEEKEA